MPSKLLSTLLFVAGLVIALGVAIGLRFSEVDAADCLSAQPTMDKRSGYAALLLAALKQTVSGSRDTLVAVAPMVPLLGMLLIARRRRYSMAALAVLATTFLLLVVFAAGGGMHNCDRSGCEACSVFVVVEYVVVLPVGLALIIFARLRGHTDDRLVG